MTVTDTLGRPLRDLRISVTDRCNFRRIYCMPREVFGRDYQFLERAELLTFEEIERLARIFCRRARGDEDPPDRRRAACAPRGGAARRDARGDPRARGPGHDHEPLGAGQEGAGAQGRRAAPDHRQPRQPGQRGVRRDQRRRLPGRARAGGDRGRRRRGARADEDQHGCQARRQRGQRSADGPPLPRQWPHRALHRVRGRRPHQRLADGRRRAGGGDRRDDRRRAAARAGRAELPRGGRRALALPGRQRRDRRRRLGDAAVLRRLHARPDVGRGQAVHLPVRRQGPRPARAAARRCLRRGDLRGNRRDLAGAGGPLLRVAHGRDGRAAEGRDSPTSAGRRAVYRAARAWSRSSTPSTSRTTPKVV